MVAAATWRRAQAECVTRGEAAIARWKQQGGGQTVDAVMDDLQTRLYDALREGMRLLSWSPYTCRRAALGNGRSRELIVPFGGTGYIVLFEIVGHDVVVGAVRHQREDDYRH